MADVYDLVQKKLAQSQGAGRNQFYDPVADFAMEIPKLIQGQQINKEELEIEKLRFQAEGKRAEDNIDYQKKANQLRVQEARDRLQQQGLSSAAAKEARKDLRNAQIEGLKLGLEPVLAPLKEITGFIGKTLSMFGINLPSFGFGKIVGLVAIVGLINFLRSDFF